MVVFWVPLGDGYFDARNDASDFLDFRLESSLERYGSSVTTFKAGSDVVSPGRSIFVDMAVSVVNTVSGLQYTTRCILPCPKLSKHPVTLRR